MHVAQDPIRHGVRAVDRGGRQLRERILIAALRPFHETGPHIRSCPGRRSGCLTSMESVPGRTFNLGWAA